MPALAPGDEYLVFDSAAPTEVKEARSDVDTNGMVVSRVAVFGRSGRTAEVGLEEQRGRPLLSIAEPAPSLGDRVLDSLGEQIAILDVNGVVTAVNRAWSEFGLANGAPGGGFDVGKSYFEICDTAAREGDAYAAQALVGLRGLAAGAEPRFELVYPCHSPQEERWFSLRAHPFAPGSGREGVIVSHREITEGFKANEAARMHARLFEGLDTPVAAFDIHGRANGWNAAAEALYGWSRDEILGRKAINLLVPDGSRQSAREAIASILRDGSWRGEFVVRRRDGSELVVDFHGAVIRDHDGVVEGVVTTTNDLTSRIEAEREVRSARDFLEAVTNSVGEGLYVVDGEGMVTFVNAAAAELLGWDRSQIVGVRMHDLIHSAHSDGTAHAFEDCPISQALVAGSSVEVDDDVFFRADGMPLPVAYAVSPVVTPDGISGSVVVFRDVTEARAEADRVRRELEQVEWAAHLRDALANGGLCLFEQPIVHAHDGSYAGREMLLRLMQNGRVVTPDKFLPAAERFGLMPQVDRWVVGQAIELAKSGPVGINLSAGALSDQGLLREIESTIKQSGIDPGWLTFEVTETAVITDESVAETFLHRLRALGCVIALDDFGTGYGGFHYVKTLPIDYLKIDQEFVKDIVHEGTSRHVVQAIVTLAAGFGLKTVAEGVENEETASLLSELGVTLLQGYLYGAPKPLETADTDDARNGEELV